MGDTQDLIKKWTDEYVKGGIPSSVRESPSGSVVWAIERLKKEGFPLRTALDLGCGKGRNSLYLASLGAYVTAFDFTPNAVEHLQAKAAEESLANNIRALVQDVTEDWPIASASMDIVIDAFCFKHIAQREARQVYRNNLLRSLRTRGHFMISFASIGDGYYGQYTVAGGAEDEQLVVDPVVGIESMLYSRDAVIRYFGPELLPFDELQNNKPSVMHGKEYMRHTYAMLMKRNPSYA